MSRRYWSMGLLVAAVFGALSIFSYRLTEQRPVIPPNAFLLSLSNADIQMLDHPGEGHKVFILTRFSGSRQLCRLHQTAAQVVLAESPLLLRFSFRSLGVIGAIKRARRAKQVIALAHDQRGARALLCSFTPRVLLDG